MTKWNLYGGLGMMPFNINTNPGLPMFMDRAARELGVILRGPYRDYDTGQIAKEVDNLPDDEAAFYVGTSLSANDAFIIASYLEKKKFKGLFMFQASLYGPHSVANNNTEFAHLIYSFNPIPFPGLGAYIPPEGPMSYKNYIRTPRHLPHPGDTDNASQEMFIGDMRRIMEQL